VSPHKSRASSRVLTRIWVRFEPPPFLLNTNPMKFSKEGYFSDEESKNKTKTNLLAPAPNKKRC
jgi:hypothetical protein